MARLLIIDQESPTRATMVELLRAAGHEVAATDSGWHAFTLCHLNSMDAVIVCLFMANLAGAETLRDLHREFPDLAMLAFAHQRGADDMSDFALWLGATRALEKPCAPEILLSAIAEVLRVKQAQSWQHG